MDTNYGKQKIMATHGRHYSQRIAATLRASTGRKAAMLRALDHWWKGMSPKADARKSTVRARAREAQAALARAARKGRRQRRKGARGASARSPRGGNLQGHEACASTARRRVANGIYIYIYIYVYILDTLLS